MPKARRQTITAIQEQLCTATLEWSPEWEDHGLGAYVIRHGVAHLLGQGRSDAAEARMLDFFFMAAFADSHETVVEPLMAWRLLGLDRAREGFERVVQECHHPLSTTSRVRSC